MKTARVREESALLLVPKGSESDPFHKQAFYNPRMRFNRSMGSLALGAAVQQMREKMVLDGLAGTGARGIRYALENSVEEIVFVEANPDAVKLLRKNVKLNKLKNAAIAEQKFHAFAGACDDAYYDFTELDPFGSPSFFLEPASLLLRKKSVLSATATDLAKLAGREPATCIRNYSSKPMRCSFGHELAVRILLKRMVEALALRDFTVKPLLCFYEGHAVKAIVECVKAPAKATQTMQSLAYANYCGNCLRRWLTEFPEKKCSCGKKPDYAGPLWSGPLSDGEFVKKTIGINEGRGYADKKQMAKTLSLLLEENSLQPLFYDLHELAKALKKPAPKTNEFVECLREQGFSASATHFTPTGVRTGAGVEELKKAFENRL